MTHVAEIVTFTLTDGTSPEEYVKLSQASEAFVRSAPGFVHRQLSQGEDGRWTDYVIWTDLKAAQDAAAQLPQQECAAGMMAAINPESIQMRHENVLWKMTA
ncbi:hypothetical protein [Ruegeria profundi]|uniref:ABM domain-containing protein n=1 Tax=Ruegeria profundi TaxID=1685378 RepID=A0A0X3U2K2_9RHOB|nr:hypothetical protein [Ruegeria profundi]KUJ82004.1 hypothetical protein AVO44_01630 [Ruegeria profundi]MCA0927245.1 hypothetical protein [Ruegeria profundi]